MKKWVKLGLLWAVILYVITILLFPIIDGEKFKTSKILLGIPLWIVTGLIIGYLFDRRKKKGRL